ncbi:MAG: thioredoxin-disulfide reductase [bacterium]
MTENQYDTIIIGSGPAGLTAAIYTSRAKLNTLVIGGYVSGGQLMITSEVENFPGFPDGVMGPELMMNMRKQAEKMGANILDMDVDKVDLSKDIKEIFVGDKIFTAPSIIIATGASAMWLGLDSEKKFMGRGVSGCATCDGAFFRDKTIAVVGGGDSALEEATFLTRFASKVYLIHRKSEFRASKVMQERVLSNPKISVLFNKRVNEIIGDKKVSSVKLSDTIDNSESTLELEGVFIAIGHRPNTDFLKGSINIDEKGYIIPKQNSDVKTDIEGVFVAGDVFDHRYRQAITAAGSGCKAAIEVEKYLEEKV